MDNISDQMTANFLHAAILTLRQEVVPALSTPEARINADLVSRVLYMLHSRFSRRSADLRLLIDMNRSLLNEIATILPEQEADAPIDSAAANGGAFSAIEKLEEALYRDELLLTSRIPQLLKLAASDDPVKADAKSILHKIVNAQKQFLSAQDPDILKGSYVCYQGGRITEERAVERPLLLGAEITEASLSRHLQSRFPGSHVEKLSIMAGGFSKTTIFFTLVHASGDSESLVMRKDLPVEFISSISSEFRLLRQLHKAGYPVAEPLWFEDDPEPFGGRFMVSRRVGGSTDFSRWASDKHAVEEFARQLAKVMADLHALKLEQLGYSREVTAKSAGDLMRAEIERWYTIFVRHRREIYPIQEIAMAWIKANIPETLFARPASLIHGDIGFHNLMIDNGQVTALLDWEFSHLGDPIEDLLYTKPFIEKVMNWETFKSYYREYGGAACTTEEEFFYSVWSKARNPVSCVHSTAVFLDSLPHNIKFATTGILGRYLELEAGQMVLDTLDNDS